MLCLQWIPRTSTHFYTCKDQTNISEKYLLQTQKSIDYKNYVFVKILCNHNEIDLLAIGKYTLDYKLNILLFAIFLFWVLRCTILLEYYTFKFCITQYLFM